MEVTKICRNGHEYAPRRGRTGKWVTCKQCAQRTFALLYKENRQERINKTLAWQKANPQKLNAKGRRWCKANPEKMNIKTAKRYSALKQQTPPWLSEKQKMEMSKCYSQARELSWLSEGGLTVDHIIPLQGDNVCGLHVPWNLQILPASLNYSKGNSA